MKKCQTAQVIIRYFIRQEAKLYKEIEDIDPAEHVRVSEGRIAKIRAATQQDATLTRVIYNYTPGMA